jgi:GNAT superfamily N-acetyltransferase
MLRDAEPDEYPEVSELIGVAYAEYASALDPRFFSVYLADLVDVARVAEIAEVLVIERGGRIEATAKFLPDAGVQGAGIPRGWAGLRGMAVHPSQRGRGLARQLLEETLVRARSRGCPMLLLHTASFMTAAVALYRDAGFRRAPAFDLDVAGYFGVDVAPIMAPAYVLPLMG